MTRLWRSALLLSLLTLSAGLTLLASCATLPPLDGRRASAALDDTDDTRLGRAIAPRVAAHPGLSAVHPLSDSRDAFVARALLARAAERSLDVQYYIWRRDLSGTLLLAALREAAGRGVRVRLLLDDINTAGFDETLAALDADANIEVRLFNPYAIRSPRWVNYLVDFPRLNRRMHNKSFTADNQATVVGGRNVGDEYFGATDEVLFVDLDVIAVGPVVGEVSDDFDRYWASASAYPAARLLAPAGAAQLAELETFAARAEHDPAAAAYLRALRESPLVHDLIEGRLPLLWAPMRLISDDPAKGLGLAASDALLLRQLIPIFDAATDEIKLVSPYFVPAAAGTEAFAALAERGVDVAVLTNSLEATDVAAVHAGYATRRRALLDAGVTLYELRRAASDVDAGVGSGAGPFGSSGASLHAKTFAIDRSRVFIGSFNFDPRSAQLNTEMGLLIDSAALAQHIADAFATRVPAEAYRVRLDDDGELYWLERRPGEQRRYDTEPGTGFWQRAGVWMLSMLPIEWLL